MSTGEGYVTKQAFNLLTMSELKDLPLTNGGKKLLSAHLQASTLSSSSVPVLTPVQPSVSGTLYNISGEPSQQDNNEGT